MPEQTSQLAVNTFSSSVVRSSYGANYVDSVIDYLAKPVPITQGLWATNQAAATILYSTDLWAPVFNNAMWNNKLTGFYGLRATAVVKVVLNATPFHQGRLKVAYYPDESQTPAKAAAHVSNLIPISQLPGIEFTPDECSVTLRIPYLTPARFIEMTSVIISWGKLYLFVMNPLQTGSSGPVNAEYTIWMSLEDVELYGQTNKAIQLQSMAPKRKAKIKRLPPSEKESPPVASALSGLANVADSLGRIPLLTTFCAPASWALNVMSNVAYSLGWSKPILGDRQVMVSSNFNYYNTTSDGFDNAQPLAVMWDAKLTLTDECSPMGQDEMSVNFIKSQWSYLNSFTLNTTDSAGSSLYRLDLTPNSFLSTVGTYETYMTPLTFISQFAQLYRGGVEFCIKFNKTGFHAGSIVVTYVPGPHDSSLSLTNTSYCYRTVVDIQEGKQMCVKIPYLLPLDYIDTNISFGAVYVNVVNPLRAPETCSSTVDCFVYIRGAEDFELQMPMLNNPFMLPIMPQVGGLENFGEIICSPIGKDIAQPDYDVTFAESSCSESFTSLLQLLKRYTPVRFVWGTPASDTTINVWPWTVSSGRYVGGIYTPEPNLQCSLQSCIFAPFAYMRGSSRFRVSVPVGSQTTNTPFITRGSTYASTVSYVTTDAGISAINNSVVSPTVNSPGFNPYAFGHISDGGLAVSVPYQGPYRFIPIKFYFNSAANSTSFQDPRPLLKIHTGNNRDMLVSRAFGEDFQLMYFVGIPRMKL